MKGLIQSLPLLRTPNGFPNPKNKVRIINCVETPCQPPPPAITHTDLVPWYPVISVNLRHPDASMQPPSSQYHPAYSGSILLSLKHFANLKPTVLTLTLPPPPWALGPPGSIAVGFLGTKQASVIFQTVCWVVIAGWSNVQCWVGVQRGVV